MNPLMIQIITEVIIENRLKWKAKSKNQAIKYAKCSKI